jgi:isoleucyl-tRNA synthetase
LYANVDGFDNKAPQVPVENRPEIDRWIISYLNTLVKEVKACYEDYDVTTAGRKIQDFVCDHLSNWYVRLNRKRFWGGSMSEDKLAAYQTLYSCLETVAVLAAPIAPFFMERLFQDLNAVSGMHTENSVHLVLMPEVEEKYIDKDLEERMALAQQSTSMVLALRKKVNIKVRQPLAKIIIPVLDSRIQEQLEKVKDLVLGEINVKEIEFITNTEGLITKKIKPNFKTLGKKYGKMMKDIAAAFAQFTQSDISAIEASENYSFTLAGSEVVLESADYEITSEDMPGWLVASEGKLTVAMDITITDSLKKEGLARELINRIQNLRKDKDFEITDRIEVTIEKRDDVADALSEFDKYVCEQTLSEKITLVESLEGADEVEWADDNMLRISIKVLSL